MTIKIVVADDHRLFREGLINLLKRDESFEITGVAKNGKEAIERVEELNPDILIMDIGMPEMNGIEATRQLKKQKPELKIIALSMHSDKQHIINMLKAGTDAYLLKTCSSQKLKQVIHSVNKNKKYLSDEITGLVIADYLQTIQS